MNVAIYLRVSKEDGSQDEANQAPDCLQLCEARGWPDPVMFSERASGASTDRPEWRGLVDLARRGICNVIVVWAFDRVGRSFWETMDDVRKLDAYGCRLISVRENWLDTGGPMGPVLVAFCAWAAEQERSRMIERTKAGIERARAKGKRIGRPPAWVDPVQLQTWRGQGVTVPEISRRFQVSARTIANHLARLQTARKGGGNLQHKTGGGRRR